MPSCNLCCEPLNEPLYTSQGHRSLTTMLRLYDQPTELFFCSRCGHLQTTAIVDLDDYYAHQYSILAESGEEDTLYQVVEGRPVFQVEHRVRTLLEKVVLPPCPQVLDFGCAKGAVLNRLRREVPDVVPHYFDVTDRYLLFWRQWAVPDQWATGTPPQRWAAAFDLVCSFYVLEHVADPVSAVGQMAELLKPGGTLYFLVPNALANVADLIVADHQQHYSEPSLHKLLDRVGLELLDLDSVSHESAYIVVARKPSSPGAAAVNCRRAPVSVPTLQRKYSEAARFWNSVAERLVAFERRTARRRPACIYGAGFYGHFVASCLADAESWRCFVDQNPYLHGRAMLGKPVIAPRHLPADVEVVYAGLNPASARQVISAIQDWQTRRFDTFFL